MENWFDITRSDKYQELPDEDKVAVKQRFFERVMLPKMDADPDLSDPDVKQSTFMKFMQSPDDTGEGIVRSTLGSAARGFGEIVPGTIEGVGALTGIEPIREAGKSVREGLEYVAPVNPIYEQGIPSKLANVAGNIGNVVLTGGIGGATSKALAAERIAAAGTQAARQALTNEAIQTGAKAALYGTGAAQGAAEGANVAEQYGMTGPQAYLRTLAGSASELLPEKLPFGTALETALPRRVLGGVDDLGKAIPGIRMGAAQEGLEEMATQGMGNVATQVLAPTGTETPGLTEGMLEAGALGAFGGALLGGISKIGRPQPPSQVITDALVVNAADTSPDVSKATESALEVVQSVADNTIPPAPEVDINLDIPEPQIAPTVGKTAPPEVDILQPQEAPVELPDVESGLTDAGITEGDAIQDFGLKLRNIQSEAGEPAETLFELPPPQKRNLSQLRDAVVRQMDETQALVDGGEISSLTPQYDLLLNKYRRLETLLGKIESKMLPPSPAMEMPEKSSQTTTDSNGEIAPEMSVPPPTAEAGAGVGEAIQAPKKRGRKPALAPQAQEMLAQAAAINKGEQTAPSTENEFVRKMTGQGAKPNEAKIKRLADDLAFSGVGELDGVRYAIQASPDGTFYVQKTTDGVREALALGQPDIKTANQVAIQIASNEYQGVSEPNLTSEESSAPGAGMKEENQQTPRDTSKAERLKYLKSREVNTSGGTSLSDAEDEELAELTGQFPPTYRDPSKPEQMLPREVEKAAVEKKLSEGVGARLKGANKKSYVLGVEAGARREHRSAIADAFDDNKPVSTEAVDTYGIELPEGYARQGELYIFQPSSEKSDLGAGAATTPAKGPLKVTTPEAGKSPQTAKVATPTETASPSAKEEAVASVQSEPAEGSIPAVERESAITAIESTEKTDVADVVIQEVVDESTDLNPITDEMVDSSLSPVEKREAAIILGKKTWADSKALFKQRMADWMAGANETSKKLIKFFKTVANKARLLLAASIGLSMASSTSDVNLATSDQFRAFKIPVSSILNSKPARPQFGSLPDMSIGIPEQKIPLGLSNVELNKRPKIDTRGKKISSDAAKTAQWVLDTADSEGYPFIVTDKIGATMYFFDEKGVLLKKSPVLVGKNVGDFIGNTDAGRITPSGRFEIAPETDAAYGNVFSVMGTDMVDSETGELVEVAIHRLALHDPSEKRPQRIATATPLDNRISWGCMNLDNKVMDWAFNNYPLGGLIYILPETAKGRSVFAPLNAANIESSKQLAKNSNVDLRDDLNRKEDKKLEAAQKKREELNLKTLNSLIQKTRTNVVQGTVNPTDANQAVAILNSSGEIPNVLFTWIGTSKDFLADPANRVRYPETWAAVSANSNIEGMSENGQPLVFTDNVGVSDLDRKLANLQGTTPEVAAVRRVILHENIHKGMFFLSLKEKMKLFQFLHRLYSPEELDQLAKSYDEYADWRTNQVSYFSIIEEAMTRDFDSMVEIPRDGIWAEFMQFLRDIWQKITGKTSEPKLKDYKDVFRLIRNSLKNSEKANADRLKNGGSVRMSMSEFISNVTPEQDAEYMAAVESGDVAKQQAMVDAAAKAAGYNKEGWHGSGSGNFSTFKLSEAGGVFIAQKKSEAAQFAIGKDASLRRVFVKGDFGKQIFRSVDELRASKQAQRSGKDGILVSDSSGWDSFRNKPIERAVNYLVFDRNNIKSADPVTRDEHGNVIPLSRRFQTASNDIRFSKVGKGLSALFPRQSTIQDAYRAASQGQSSQFISLSDVFAKAKEANLSLTEEAFKADVMRLYDSGAIYLEGANSAQEAEAASLSIPGTSVGTAVRIAVPQTQYDPNDTSVRPYASEGYGSKRMEGVSTGDNPPRAQAIRKAVSESNWNELSPTQRAKALEGFGIESISSRYSFDATLLPVRVTNERTPKNRPASVLSSGTTPAITIQFDTSGLADLLNGDAVTAFANVFDMAQEEVIHTAQHINIYNRWKASKSTDSVGLYELKHYISMINEVAQIANDELSDGNPAVANIFTNAWNLYNPNNRASDVNDAIGKIKSAPEAAAFAMELSRMMLQVQRQDFTTETGWMRFVEAMKTLLADITNALMTALAMAKNGQVGKRLQDEIIEVDALMNELESAGQQPMASKVEYDSTNDAAFNSGAEVARNTDYDERDKAVRSTIRAAYDLAPKDNGPSVPLGQLFDIAKQSMPDLTKAEFSQILQDLYEDSGALLQAGESPFIVTTQDGQRAGSAIIVSSLPTGAMASTIDPDSTASKEFTKDIQDIESGTLKAAFAGRQFKDFKPIERTIKPAKSFQTAAIGYVDSLEAEGKSLEEIANSVISPSFLESIGIEQDLMAQDALGIEVRSRVNNSYRKEKNPVTKRRLQKLNERMSAFWQGVGSKKGAHLGQRSYLISTPRYSWMFLRDEVEKAMKERRDNILNVQFGEENATSFTQNSYGEAEKANQQAVDENVNAAESTQEGDADAELLRDGEATLDAKQKNVWEKVKDAIRTKALIAKALEAMRARKAGNQAKASISEEARNAIFQMTEEELLALDAKMDKVIADGAKTFLGEDAATDTPEKKTVRKKREKMVEVAKKRAEKGEPIEPTAEEVANEIEIAKNKASQIVYRFEELYRQGFKNPPEGMSKKEQKDSIIRAFRDQVKNPVSFEQFAERLDNLKVGEEVAERLFLTASRERVDLARVKDFKIAKRKVEIADKQASRLIYATEERFRQGSKDLETSKSGDSINKAFRDQVATPVSKADFTSRLEKLNVSQDVAERLFNTAAREKADVEAMAAYDATQGPNALKRMIREINSMRRGEEMPLRTPIPWRELLSKKASTVDEYRQRIFDAISSNEELKSATPEQKARLADLFSEAWESNRKRILDNQLERMIREQEAKGNLSKKGAEALQAKRMRIVEDINLGIFDNDELAKIMAEKFGIKSEFTDAEREKIESLIDILQDENLNRVKRNKAAYDLLETLSAQTDIPIAKLLANFWVSSVLSGMNTVFSIGMSVFSGMGELTTALSRIFISAFSNPKQLPSDVAAAFKTLARTLSAVPRQANKAWQYLVTGDQAFIDPTMNDALKNMDWASIGKNNQLAEQMAKSDKILEKVMGLFMRTVSRLLTALDLFNSGLTKEGSLSIVFRQLDLDPSKIEMLEKKSDLKAYKDDVITKYFGGNAPKTLNEKALVDSYALAEMMKALDELGSVSENADQMAMQGAMTLDPSGVGGYGYRAVKSLMKTAESGSDKLVERNLRKWDEAEDFSDKSEAFVKLALSYIFQFVAYNAANLVGVRFARFAGNKFNQSLSFLPVLGALRLFEAEFDSDRIRGKEAFTDMIKRNQITGVMAAVIGYYVLKAIADEPDDEKRGAFINGGWSNLTPEKKQQKLASGQKEYTLGFGDTVINYGNWPGSGIIAAIGSLSDLIRFSPDQWSEKTVPNKLLSAATSGVFSAMEVPALSQFQELFGSSLSSKDPNEQKLTKFSRVLGNYAGGFMPRILKDLDYLADPNFRKYETLWEKTASHIPVYRRYEGKEYYDILGQQIQRNIYPGSREFMQKPSEPAYKILGALNSRGIWLTPANAEHRMVGRGARRRKLTQEEADNYGLETGKGYKQMLLRYGQRALQMPTERARDFLLEKADDVRDRALKKVYRGYTPVN